MARVPDSYPRRSCCASTSPPGSLPAASFRPRLSLDVVFRPADSVLWCIHHTTQMIAWAREVCSADLVPLGLRPHSVYSCQHIHSSQWTICVPGLCQCCSLTQWYQPTPSFFFLNQCFSISISFADSYEVKKKEFTLWVLRQWLNRGWNKTLCGADVAAASGQCRDSINQQCVCISERWKQSGTDTQAGTALWRHDGESEDRRVVKPTYTQFNQCFQLTLVILMDGSTRLLRLSDFKVNYFSVELHGCGWRSTRLTGDGTISKDLISLIMVCDGTSLSVRH